MIDRSESEMGAAFLAVYEAEFDRLHRIAFMTTGSNASAEDIVHDAFALRRWEQIRDPAAYLRRAVVNYSTSWVRPRVLLSAARDRDSHRYSRPRLVTVLAVAVVLAATAAGAVLLTQRHPADDQRPASEMTTTPAPTSPTTPANTEGTAPLVTTSTLAPTPTPTATMDTILPTMPASNAPNDGRLIVDPLPAGRQPSAASDKQYTGIPEFVTDRVYTTRSASPEDDVAFVVSTIGANIGQPYIGEGAETVTVQGVDAQVFPYDPGGSSIDDAEAVAFGPIDGFYFQLVGYRTTRDELITAANSIRRSPDGDGAIIDEAALPTGVIERAAGLPSELRLITREAAQRPSPNASWTDGTRLVWYVSLDQSADLLSIYRIGFESVIDTSIHGHPAFVTTALNGRGRYLTWFDGSRTVLLGSTDLTDAELHAFAETLRPATAQEWPSLVDATTPSTSLESDTSETSAGATNSSVVDPNGCCAPPTTP